MHAKLKLFPLRNLTASTGIDAFMADLVAHYGVLAVVAKDRGTQFTSALW
jgi:hypothetical protein